MTPDQQDRLVRAERLLAAAQAFKAELDRDRSLSKREIRRLAIKSVVVVLVTFGLGVFAGALFSGCASAPAYDATDWLARGPAVCRVVPATAITPCRIQLETDDERVVAAVRSLTGCMVITTQVERQPAFGVF